MPWKTSLTARYKNLDHTDGKHEKEDLAWPIPIWRPRAHPVVPFRKRLFNLLSPRPRLDDIESGVVLPLRRKGRRGRGGLSCEGILGRRRREADSRRDEGHIGVGGGTRVGRGAASDHTYTRAGGVWEGDVVWDMGIDGTCRESQDSVFRVSTPRITITPTYDPPPSPRSRTLDVPRPISLSFPATSLPPTHNDISTTSLSSTLQVQLFPHLSTNTTAFPFPPFPRSSSTRPARLKLPVSTRALDPADSTRTRFPSCSSHTPSQSPTLHAPFEPLGPSYTLTYPHSLSRGTSPSHRHPASPAGARSKTQRSTAHPKNLLYLYDLRHSLNLARELLYTRNRLAMRTLASARTSSGDGLPSWVLDQWTKELDDWWARTSGLLNLAYMQIKAEIQEAEKDSQLEESLGGGRGVDGWRRGRKRSGRFWTALRKSKRGKGRSDADLGGRGGTAWRGGENCEKDHLDQLDLDHLRAPLWGVDLVPEPFGLDEIEREIWRLEGLGVVSSGTYCRMRSRGLVGAEVIGEEGTRAAEGRGDLGEREGRGDGLGGMSGFRLTRAEEVLAADLGLRGIDVDEAGKGERDGWRRRGKACGTGGIRWMAFGG